MKIMKTFIATLLIGLLIISSCRKNQLRIPPIPKNDHQLIDVKSPRIPPQNQYDSTGIWHNIFLDSLRGYVRAGGVNTREGRLNYLITFGRERFSIDISRSAGAIQEEVLADSANGFENVILHTTYSVTAKSYFLGLIRHLKSVGYSDPFGTEDYITQFEKRTLADPNLTMQEKKSALQAASVARYSYRYWSDYSTISGRLFGFIPDHWGPLAHVGALIGDVVAAVKGAVGGGKDVKQVALESAATSAEVGNAIGGFLCLGDC